MSLPKFTDEQKIWRDFDDEVAVACPACAKKAIATRNTTEATARLLCTACGYNKTASILLPGTKGGKMIMAAHGYFGAQLWYQAPFKNEVFFALNEAHLDYMEQYIGSGIRENKGRTGYTLVEKLPKYIQVATNRQPLLKLIQKLRNKVSE
jgi:hypothetical protein